MESDVQSKRRKAKHMESDLGESMYSKVPSNDNEVKTGAQVMSNGCHMK